VKFKETRTIYITQLALKTAPGNRSDKAEAALSKFSYWHMFSVSAS